MIKDGKLELNFVPLYCDSPFKLRTKFIKKRLMLRRHYPKQRVRRLRTQLVQNVQQLEFPQIIAKLKTKYLGFLVTDFDDHNGLESVSMLKSKTKNSLMHSDKVVQGKSSSLNLRGSLIERKQLQKQQAISFERDLVDDGNVRSVFCMKISLIKIAYSLIVGYSQYIAL